MAHLVVLKGPNPGQQISLSKAKQILGRHPDCDIVLDLGSVSRQHAQIIEANGQYFVEDLNSRNGTYVNGVLIQGRQQLNDNDRLKICDVLFSFRNPVVEPEPVELPGTVTAVFEDDDAGRPPSTITSTLDVKSSSIGLRVSVNPEVKLQAVLEISRNLSTALGLEPVLRKILDSLFIIFVQADRGFVVLQDAGTGRLVPRAVKHRRAGAEDTVRISRTICRQVMETKQAVLSADAASDERFDSSQSIADVRIRSMMCAPLLDSEGRALGVLQIDTLDQRSRFTQEDLDVLAAVAGQAAFAVDAAHLHEAAIEKRELERDLELAFRVQKSFLPAGQPEIPGYRFFDFYEPAKAIGGDYYDYIRLPNDRLAVVLADVAGKGVPAALLMAKLSAEARVALATCPKPGEAISQLNNVFSEVLEERFITMVACVLDPARHEVVLVNAGHMPPFLRRHQGQVWPVGEDAAGVVLGAVPGFEYEEFRVPLERGDCLVVFTDGISEAMNDAGELYGLERLRGQLSVQVSSVAALGDALLEDVTEFVGQRAQSDDMCLLCFGREG